MAGLDLSGIVTIVQDLLLLDTVRVTEAPGPAVFNAVTGEYERAVPATVYEGPGAVQAMGTPGGISSIPVAGQAWADETNSRYQLLTPLDAPVPARDQLASVVQVHDGGDTALIGRVWRIQDPGRAGTLSVVRSTSLDQIQQAEGGV